MWVQSLGQEDPLKEEMATYYSILVRRIPWTEQPSGLQSIGSQRVGHGGASEQTHKKQGFSNGRSFLYMISERYLSY